MEKTKETKRAVVRSIISCVFFMFLIVSSVVFGVDEPNNMQGICYVAAGTVETSGACPAWFTALDRNSTDAHTTEHLVIQLDGCQVFGDYEVYTMQQGAPAGYLADLQVGDLFIVWDEDEGHGGNSDFTFTGQYIVVDENGNDSIPVVGSCDYAQISSTNEAVINWVLYRVESAGTLTVNDTGLNEHDAIHLNLNIMPFTKDDDLADGQCASPEQAITYTICFDNAYGETLEDAFVIDWLPAGVDYDYLLSIFPLIFDENYNVEEHYYRWELGDLDPNETACLTLDVTVNYNAPPGGVLHNVAELWGTILVPDPNDPNVVYPETRIVARVIKDTPVCCWQDMPEVLYVDKNATAGANNGLDWQNAFIDFQDALEYARAQVCGDVNSIYIAQGVYSPGENENDSFVLPDSVSVYGGFPTGGCDFVYRDPKRYETILSGKIDDTHRNDNIVTMGDNTLLDGFTVRDASFDGQGIFGYGADFSIKNCTIERNEYYGIYIENGNATLEWCTIRNNKSDGIYHQGEGFTLTVLNCWVRQNMQYGINCVNATPIIFNSIITESDIANEGRAGIRLINPTFSPFLLNNTIAHNKGEGIALVGNTLPEIKNCIVYHNNSDGPQLAGFTADQAASYSCIQDCNSVNNNISSDPMFAYFDPNNVRIMVNSPCHDSGLTFQENYTQVDMDNRPRVAGTAVDRGAYEIDCEDTSNIYDTNADGLVNLFEFNGLSKAWLGHDPNDPVWADPNVADPNLSEGWYEWKYKYNFEPTGSSQYSIDLADLMTFLEDAPWLWKACWLDLEELQLQQMAFGSGEELLTVGIADQTLMTSQPSLVTADAASVIPAQAEIQTPQISVEAQILELKDSINFLEKLWLEDPAIQQEIDPEGWQEFMNALYQSMAELQTEIVQLE